jgi:hypothetical protein
MKTDRNSNVDWNFDLVAAELRDGSRLLPWEKPSSYYSDGHIENGHSRCRLGMSGVPADQTFKPRQRHARASRSSKKRSSGGFHADLFIKDGPDETDAQDIQEWTTMPNFRLGIYLRNDSLSTI